MWQDLETRNSWMARQGNRLLQVTAPSKALRTLEGTRAWQQIGPRSIRPWIGRRTPGLSRTQTSAQRAGRRTARGRSFSRTCRGNSRGKNCTSDRRSGRDHSVRCGGPESTRSLDESARNWWPSRCFEVSFTSFICLNK